MLYRVLDLDCFRAGWFTCVLGAATWSTLAIGPEWAVAMPTLLAVDSAARRFTGADSSPPSAPGADRAAHPLDDRGAS